MDIGKDRNFTIKASDLRGILEYVPLYRNQTFVVAIDGSVVDSDNFPNVITDIAVLRSLAVNIVVVHGIGKQLKDLCAAQNVVPSDVYGNSPVDGATLALAREASAKVLQTITDSFAARDIRCVSSNAVRATEIGIISGVNYENAGRIEKIDFDTVRSLLGLGMIPVFSPIAVNREGRVFRINSDLLAADLAAGLGATKLIFLTVTRGFMVGGEKALAVPVEKVGKILEERRDMLDPRVFSKAKYSVRALESQNTRRAHILDGREFACLLTELFDKVGCGTMIYSDDYQRIRPACQEDIQTIFNLSKISAREQNLISRSMDDIAENISSYFVYEMDGSIIAFVSLLDLGGGAAELAGLHVQPFYQGHDVGTRMVEFVRMKAKERGFKRLFALSTKSAPFFSQVCGFSEGGPSDLPPARFEKYEASGRKSKVFFVDL